jgi:hypothetical protein
MEKGGRIVTFHGAVVFSDDVELRIAEEIADAQDELRAGFLRRIKNERGEDS